MSWMSYADHKQNYGFQKIVHIKMAISSLTESNMTAISNRDVNEQNFEISIKVCNTVSYY